MVLIAIYYTPMVINLHVIHNNCVFVSKTNKGVKGDMSIQEP